MKLRLNLQACIERISRHWPFGGGTFSSPMQTRTPGAVRQARYRQTHPTSTVHLPPAVHASIKARAERAGIAIHRYIALKSGC